jgi:hypothetical protein
MQVLLNEEELSREADLFAPNRKEYKKLAGVKLNLLSLVEEPEKEESASERKSEKAKKPAVFVPPSC